MPLRTVPAAALTAVLALSGAAGASAASTTHAPSKAPAPPAAKKKSLATAKGRIGTLGPVRPVKGAGTSVSAISAFPTGGKGSGTEATCDLWSDQLQEDEGALDAATEKQDIIDASNTLNADVDNALDAGCFVIYSKTLSASRAKILSGAVTPSMTTTGGGTATARITAFPAGGKGSGTEATCALWTRRLQDDEQVVDDAPETDKQDAAGPLEKDTDNALDAGCAVID